MNDLSGLAFKKAECTGPYFYHGTFDVEQQADTFFDAGHLGKGQLWVNGHALGRPLEHRPAESALPARAVAEGPDEVVILDLDGKPGVTMEGFAKPDLGE